MEHKEAAKLLDERRRDLEEVRSAAERQLPPPPGDEELASYDQHPADLANETVQREQGLSMVEMADTSLREVSDAMRRLDEGKYGICEVCGRAIPEERLKAMPETPFCVEHAAGAAS